MCAVFSHAERFVLREKEIHLSRGFGVGSELELYFQAIYNHLLASFSHVVSWLDKCDKAC